MYPRHGRCVAGHEETDPVPDRVRSTIAYRVAAGYDTEAEIVEQAVELAEATGDAAGLRAAIERLTAQRVALHRAMQPSWAYPTDCHRLDLAFKMLNRHGVVARQNLGGCFHCGIDQIESEAKAAQLTQCIKGYAFFTATMLQHAIFTGQLLLFHGAVAHEPSPDDISAAIVRELRNTGLDAHWDGWPDSPVIVDRMLWRKRR